MTDLITLAEAKDVLEYDSATHDDEISALITAVSGRIDDMCGPVVQRTVTGETHDGGRPWVRLIERQAVSASSVVEYRLTAATTLSAETNTTKTADDYLLDDIGDGIVLLRRRSNGADKRFPSGRRNVVATYTAGRYADTVSVDELFKRAAVVFCQHLLGTTAPDWHTNPDWQDQTPTQRMRVPGFATPHFVRDLLADELRGPAVA